MRIAEGQVQEAEEGEPVSDNTDELREMLDELCELESGLSSWEMNFVDGLAKRNRLVLTPREEAKLREIAEDRLD